MAPGRNNAKQVDYMKSKTSTWGAYIQAGNLTQLQAYITTSSTIWKTIEYPLLALDLTQDEVKSVTWPALKPALKKMGLHPCTTGIIRQFVHWNFQNHILYSLKNFGHFGCLGEHLKNWTCWQHLNGSNYWNIQVMKMSELFRGTFRLRGITSWYQKLSIVKIYIK